jgi:hypothetical protein
MPGKGGVVERDCSIDVGRLNVSIRFNQSLHSGRYTVLRRVVKRGPAVLVLFIRVGSSFEELAHPPPVHVVGARISIVVPCSLPTAHLTDPGDVLGGASSELGACRIAPCQQGILSYGLHAAVA